MIAAAGNIGAPLAEYPARFPDVGAITSVDDADLKAPFSNFGLEIDLSAPGVEIVSLAPGGGYGWASGTSVSTALVTGGVALGRELNRVVLSNELLEVFWIESVDIDALNHGFEGMLGAGRLNILAAIQVLEASLSTAPDLRPATCVGDANSDGSINFNDLTTVLVNWLKDYTVMAPAQWGPGDANGDGLVNFADIGAVLSNWLAACL